MTTSMVSPVRILACAVGVLVASLTVACGGTTTSAPVRELDSLTGVATRSAAVDSAGFDLALEMRLPGAPEPFALGAEGAFDTARERGHVTVDLSSMAALLGSLGGSFADATSGGLGTPDDWRLETIVDGAVVYVRVPEFASGQIPGGKHWVKGDLQTLSQAGGTSLDLGALGGSDPREALDVLRAVSGEIETVGRDAQRGVEATHYRATLDLAALARRGSGEQVTDTLANLGPLLEQSGLSTIPVDVWVDDDGLLRRIDLSFAISQPGQGEAAGSLRLELFDYGEPVTIALPPSGDVADAATLQPGP
jgi:hypothetical protein